MPDGYLTSSFLENKGDLPIALPTTKLRRGDWLVLATLKLQPPMQLQFRDLQLSLIQAVVDPTLTSVLVAPARGLAYVAIFKDYAQSDPATMIPQGSSTDVVSISATGVSQRDPSAAPLVISPAAPSTYSVLLVNNTTGTDLQLSVNGQLRLDLGL